VIRVTVTNATRPNAKIFEFKTIEETGLLSCALLACTLCPGTKVPLQTTRDRAQHHTSTGTAPGNDGRGMLKGGSYQYP
jgi:hypothetical protein